MSSSLYLKLNNIHYIIILILKKIIIQYILYFELIIIYFIKKYISNSSIFFYIKKIIDIICTTAWEIDLVTKAKNRLVFCRVTVKSLWILCSSNPVIYPPLFLFLKRAMLPAINSIKLTRRAVISCSPLFLR